MLRAAGCYWLLGHFLYSIYLLKIIVTVYSLIHLFLLSGDPFRPSGGQCRSEGWGRSKGWWPPTWGHCSQLSRQNVQPRRFEFLHCFFPIFSVFHRHAAGLDSQDSHGAADREDEEECDKVEEEEMDLSQVVFLSTWIFMNIIGFFFCVYYSHCLMLLLH